VHRFLPNELAEFYFIYRFESNSCRPAAAMQTPPSKSSEVDASTPEVGLLEPLSVSTIASWMDHAWYDEPLRAIDRGIDQAFELLDQVEKEGCDLNLVHRIKCLIDYLLDCFSEQVGLPECHSLSSLPT
jgi:hypothetical protein